jgi:hypothetical protein
VVINTHDYTHSKASNATSVTGTFGSPHHASVGSSTHQVPIAAELVPIVDALDPKYWNSVSCECHKIVLISTFATRIYQFNKFQLLLFVRFVIVYIFSKFKQTKQTKRPEW